MGNAVTVGGDHFAVSVKVRRICTGTGPAAATSAPGLSPTAAISAPGPGPPLPYLHCDAQARDGTMAEAKVDDHSNGTYTVRPAGKLGMAQ